MATGGSGGLHAGKYILTGILTIIPLWVSLMVFEFVLGTLSSAGLPWLRLLANRLRVDAPLLADWLTRRWVERIAGGDHHPRPGSISSAGLQRRWSAGASSAFSNGRLPAFPC